MIVRPVEAADVPGVVALVTDVLAEFGLEFGKDSPTDAGVRGLPASYAGGGFWVALRATAGADELLGTIGMYPLAPDVLELRKMYVRPAARGLGVGKRLFDVAIAFARERRAKQVVLDTLHEMTRAIAFYEAHGFVRDDRQIRGARCSRGYALALAGD